MDYRYYTPPEPSRGGGNNGMSVGKLILAIFGALVLFAVIG